MDFFTYTIEKPLHHYDFSKQAGAFFVHYQDPSVIIAATSLLCFIQTINHLRSKDKVQAKVAPVTQVFFFISFGLSSSALLLSVIQQSIILRKDFDPKATNPYELLKREFELEYTAIQLAFMLSLFFLFSGLTAFLLFCQDGKLERAFVVTAACTFVSAILSYINSTLSSRDNFSSLVCNLGRVIWEKSIYIQKPIHFLSLFSFTCCVASFVLMCVKRLDAIVRSTDYVK